MRSRTPLGGTTTLADSEAGFQFNITNVGNPYAGPNRRDRLHRHMCASDSHERVSDTWTLTIELPFGFILRAGSTVATEQMNFGDFNAIYVSSQV